jgi:hypothetical protein
VKLNYGFWAIVRECQQCFPKDDRGSAIKQLSCYEVHQIWRIVSFTGYQAPVPVLSCENAKLDVVLIRRILIIKKPGKAGLVIVGLRSVLNATGVNAQQRIGWTPADNGSCQRYDTYPAPDGLWSNKHQADKPDADDGANRSIDTTYILFHFSALSDIACKALVYDR